MEAVVTKTSRWKSLLPTIDLMNCRKAFENTWTWNIWLSAESVQHLIFWLSAHTAFRTLSRDVLFSVRNSGYQLGCTVAAVSALWPVQHVKNALQNITTEGTKHSVFHRPFHPLKDVHLFVEVVISALVDPTNAALRPCPICLRPRPMMRCTGWSNRT